jgi:hypothetical protein
MTKTKHYGLYQAAIDNETKTVTLSVTKRHGQSGRVSGSSLENVRIMGAITDQRKLPRI